MKCRAWKNETILLSGRLFIGREIFARFDVRWCHQTFDALALHQSMQQFSERAAGWIDPGHAAAETKRCARYVYTAAARITLWRRTAQFSRRFDMRNVDENIDSRIDRKSDDIRHD